MNVDVEYARLRVEKALHDEDQLEVAEFFDTLFDDGLVDEFLSASFEWIRNGFSLWRDSEGLET